MRTMLFGLLSRCRHSLVRLLWSARLDGGDPSDGSFASVRVPLRRGPGGRTSAVALTEPEDARTEANAVGNIDHR